MSKPIVTGLLAYGMSGRIFHAPFLTANPGFKLKAVVERNEKKCATRYPDIVSYNSVDVLLSDNEIELVVVNTPSFTHYELAMQALNAGKHVLIEKPIASTGMQVKSIYDLARKVNKQVMVYQNRRWDSDFLSVKQIIESGKLGELIEVHFRYDRYKPQLSPKKFKEEKGVPASGLVYDLGPHLIDGIISLFGKPLTFIKATAIHRDDSVVIDYFNFHLSYPNQLNVYVTSGLLIADTLPAFVVHGKLGSFVKNRCDVQEPQLDAAMLPTDATYGVEPENCEGRLVLMDVDANKTTSLIKSPKGNYAALFDAVYHTIRENALYPITEEHIAWQMELLEA